MVRSNANHPNLPHLGRASVSAALAVTLAVGWAPAFAFAEDASDASLTGVANGIDVAAGLSDALPVLRDGALVANPLADAFAAAPQSLDGTGLSVAGGVEGTDFTVNSTDKKIVFTSEKPMRVSGTSQGYTLEVAAGVHATLVLDGVTIQFNRKADSGRIPINIVTNLRDVGGTGLSADATDGKQITNPTSLHLILADGSENSFAGGYGAPAIRCGEGSVLIIDDEVVNFDSAGNHVVPFEGRVPADLTLQDGTRVKAGEPLYAMDSVRPGKLTALGGCGGAGMGSAPHENCGSIIIDGGHIDTQAYGNHSTSAEHYDSTGAGIGGSYGGGGGDIVINGGVVNALGSYHGAGIGAGCTSIPSATTISVPEYEKPILPGIIRTREYKLGQKARNITVNGGNVTTTGYIHGFAVGAGCMGLPEDAGATLKVTGGNLNMSRDLAGAGSTADYGGYIGANNLAIVVQGGSFNVPYFGFATSPSSATVTDGRGRNLTQIAIDLAGYDGLAGAQLKSLKVTVDGAPLTDEAGDAYEYGLPYGVDGQNKVYFWLPNSVNGKTVAIGDFVVSTLNNDGTRTEVDSEYDFVVPSAGAGSLAKRYVEIDIDSYVASTPGLQSTLVKRYDGLPIAVDDSLKNTIAAFDVPAGEPKGKTIANVTHMTLFSHRITDHEGKPTTDEIKPGGAFIDAGGYEVLIESNEWSADENFSKSFWGHKLYLTSTISPADSEVSVVTHTIDTNAGTLAAVNLEADVLPRTFAQGDLGPEAKTCGAPTGKLQFYANGTPVGDPVEVQPQTGTHASGYAYSKATYAWTDIANYQIPRGKDGKIEIQGKFLGGMNYTASEGESSELDTKLIPDFPFTDNPEVTVKPSDPNGPVPPPLELLEPPTSGPADPEAENKDLKNTLHYTMGGSYSRTVDPTAAPIGPEELMTWAAGRFAMPEGYAPVSATVEQGGAPAGAVDPSAPGQWLVKTVFKDRVTGNTITLEIDYRVTEPPSIAPSKPGTLGDPDEPLQITDVKGNPEAGTVEGSAKHTVTRPERPGETDTPEEIKQWVEDYYTFPEGSTVSTPKIFDENGNPVDEADASGGKRYTVTFDVTDPAGNTTHVTVDYGYREPPALPPDAPAADRVIEVLPPTLTPDDTYKSEYEDPEPVYIEINPEDHEGPVTKKDIEDEARERYGVPDDWTVGVMIVTNPGGQEVDEIDTSKPGTYTVTVTMTTPEGDTVTVTMYYIVGGGDPNAVLPTPDNPTPGTPGPDDGNGPTNPGPGDDPDNGPSGDVGSTDNGPDNGGLMLAATDDPVGTPAAAVGSVGLLAALAAAVAGLRLKRQNR